MKTYIITEAITDRLLLEKLVSNKENVQFMNCSGYSSAISTATSILGKHQHRVVLVVDANSSIEEAIRERYNFIEYMLGSRSIYEGEYKIALFAPQLESIFFEDKDIADQITGYTLSTEEYITGKFKPRDILKNQLSKIGTNLTDSIIERLRELPQIKEINSFISESYAFA
jgi:hypothetical protein